MSLLFYKFTLTPEVKKLVFIVVDFMKFFFFLITEGKDTESREEGRAPPHGGNKAGRVLRPRAHGMRGGERGARSRD